MNPGMIVRRTILITLSAILVLLAIVFVAVHTSMFARYVRKKIIQIAQEELGSRVAIQGLSIPWSELAVDVHGLTIHGREGSSRQPFLRVRRLRVAIDAGALLGRRFELSEVILDSPVLRITADSEGRTNVPRPNSTGLSAEGSSSTVSSLFNLAVRHVEIDQGAVYYQDTKIPLSANLTDFGADVYFNHRLDEYDGRVGYKSGWIALQNSKPVENGASLQFAATPAGIRCNPLSIVLPQSRVSLYANVQNYFQPQVSGKYTAQISTAEIAQALRQSSLPIGSISAAGTVSYRYTPESSFLEALRLEGTLSSSQLALHLRQITAPVRALRASFSLQRGLLRIANMRGDTLGGKLSMNAGEISLTGNSGSRLSATLAGVSLSELYKSVPDARHERLSLTGSADLSARLAWSGHFRDVNGDAAAKIYMPPGRQLRTGEIALNGSIRVAYQEALDQVSLGQSVLRVGSTTVSASGVMSKHSNLMLTLSAGDLHQLAELAAEAGAAGTFRVPSISGSARFDGRAYGSLHDPHITGHLAARDLQFESTQWRTVQTDVALSRSRAAVTNAALALQDEGRIRVDGSIELRDWSLAPSSAVSLRATATGLRISRMQALAHADYPVDGTVSADISVTGTRQAPSGQGWIRVEKPTVWNQPLDLVSVNFHGDASSLHADLAARSPVGQIQAAMTYDSISKQYQASVRTAGIKLADLEMVQAKHLPVSGTLIISGNGNGSLENPGFSAQVRIPELAFRGETMSEFHTQLNLANRQLHYSASGSTYGGNLISEGNVALTGRYETTATLDVRSVSVGMLAARLLRNGQPAPKGQVSLHAEMQGPLKDPSQLNVRAEIPAMTLTYQTVELSLANPLVANYQNGVVTLQRSEVKGNGVDLEFQGAIPVKSSEPFRLETNGTVNLAPFQGMTPGFQSSGVIRINFAAQGKLAQPNMQGSLRLENVSLSTASFPVDLSNMNGDVQISGRRVEIVSLNGSVNGGSINAQGSLDLGDKPIFDLAASAKSVNISYPTGVRARLDGNLRLTGASSGSVLTGRVVIDYLDFTQQMDIASLASQFSSESGVSTPSPFERRTKLNIAIQSSSTLSLASSQLSIQGAANLNVVGTLADPVVLGRTTLTGGELFFLGKRYDIKSGTIQFANPTRTSPSLDLYATTTVNQYNISLHFLGPMDQMKTSFTSTPALPQADIINLLAFGQTTEQAATSASTPGGLGAESVLAQGVASQVSGKIQKLAGLSQLSITPVIAANGVQQNPGAQVAIQQRVSGRLLVTFTTNTAETQSTAVQVQYQLGRGLSVSALRDQNGGYGLDLHLHKSF